MNQQTFTDYYKVLEVDRKAPMAQIRESYIRLAKKHHPDVGGSAATMKKLNEAYDTLKDERLRADYNHLYTRYMHLESSDTSEQALYDELTQELNLIKQARQSAKAAAIKGVVWLILGAAITGITYANAKPGGTYSVAYGAMIIGSYQFLRGLYFFFNPHALLKKAFKGKPIPHYYQKKAQATQAFAKVAFIAVGLIIAMSLVGGALNNKDNAVLSTDSNNRSSADSGASTSSATASNLANIKQTYNDCSNQYNTMQSQLDDMNSRMDAYNNAGNISAYNSLVPQQNSLVAQLKSKYAECEQIRGNYNSLVNSSKTN